MHYLLVPALPADYVWLENLRREVYQELFQLTWGGWDEERHQRHFAACLENGSIQLMVVDGEKAGMLQLHETDDSLEIGEIQIGANKRSLGLGSQVIRDVLALAQAENKSVKLSVGLKNEKALRLYQRLGFKITEQSETHFHLLARPAQRA